MNILLYLCCQLVNSLNIDAIVFGFMGNQEYKELAYA